MGPFSIHKCQENQNWFHNSKVIVKLFSSFSPYFNQKQICLVPRLKGMSKWIIFNDFKNRSTWIESIFDPLLCLFLFIVEAVLFREYCLGRMQMSISSAWKELFKAHCLRTIYYMKKMRGFSWQWNQALMTNRHQGQLKK